MPTTSPRQGAPGPPKSSEPATTAEPFADARAALASERDPIAVAPAKPRAAIHTSGDLDVEPGADVAGSLATHGSLRVGAGARLRADARAGGGATIGDRARLDGHLDVKGEVSWGAGARASSVDIDGAFVTSDGLRRATRVRAKHGIQPVSDDGHGGGRP